MSEKRKDNKGRILQVGEYYDEQNQRYMFRKMINGHRETITAPDLVTLRKQKNEMLCRLDKGAIFRKDSNKTLNEYFDFWYITYAKSGRKATTCRTYRDSYNAHIRKGIGKKKITKITKEDCQKVFNDMLYNNLSQYTLANLKSCLKVVFDSAVDEDIVLKNPICNIKLPHKGTKKRKIVKEKVLTEFFEYVKNKPVFSINYAALAFLFNTGCRIGELCAITWSDVDFECNTITIDKSLNRYRKEEYGFTLGIASTKSDSSNRTIKMNNFLREILLQHKLQGKKCISIIPFVNDSGKIIGEVSGFVFANSRGKVWCEPSFLKMLNRIFNQYNDDKPNSEIYKFVPHEARHTYTGMAYSAGADIKVVSFALGHKSVTTTADIYLQLTEEKQYREESILSTIKIS